MEIKSFYDTRTSTLSYVVYDVDTRDAVVIDPVLDYEPKSSKTWTESADALIAFVKDNDLKLQYILETHAHADHLSGSQIVQQAFPQAKLAVGERITEVQKVFKNVFDLPADFPTDGRQFDLLLNEDEPLQVGTLTIETIFTPGHTPACVTYKVEDAIFTGDALFMPDMGTGRCDFPGGSSADLYESVQKLYALPDDTRVFVGHDYQPGGRELAWETTIGEQKANNIQIPAGRSKEEFIKFRDERDAGLEAPRLLFQSVQVNVDAGHLPQPSGNEVRYLRIPVNVFKPSRDEGETELNEV
ncbi:MBL fold metallo-hydrolase [Bradymonas sediminis]|uniref:MBL fold metallo-hydrolase n=1 Tax=Bradymonas sediminis TaxID=1548548 RepID=A0A2Z4FN59_9DELT|nr:MBL fold metallo-hydrolase [Bradymonas sediminis]AWV90372.1 MBL fold metallo-hydrolase [Bradymonas sediminis]TDP72244.1 glyoxylase-like metal-dependent hydrolase (beta-lactamase superfamily II) [Bradymonas sediminis]